MKPQTSISHYKYIIIQQSSNYRAFKLPLRPLESSLAYSVIGIASGPSRSYSMLPDTPQKHFFKKPPSLPQLIDRLKSEKPKCLDQQLACHGQCEAHVDVESDGELDTAIEEERLQLRRWSDNRHLARKKKVYEFVARLGKIAQNLCCSDHRKDLMIMEDFAIHWILIEEIDRFLQRQCWRWVATETWCGLLVHGKSCQKLKQSTTVGQEEISQPLYQFLADTKYPNVLSDELLDALIVRIVRGMTYTSHGERADIVSAKAKLKENILQITEGRPSAQEHKNRKAIGKLVKSATWAAHETHADIVKAEAKLREDIRRIPGRRHSELDSTIESHCPAFSRRIRWIIHPNLNRFYR